jgi:pimeloyl-ACP methyl ester carboxylesterase
MLRPLARTLLNEGWPVAHRITYPSFRSDLDDIVEALARVVRPLAEDGPVDCIGHSMGAVAIRAWVKCGDGADYVRHFVSLGGPHAGTSLHRLAPRVLRDVLDPDGPWVERLAEGPEPVPTTVIRSAWDQQVLPPIRASIPGVPEVVLDTHGHNGLLWSTDAHAAVVAALSGQEEG